MTSRGEWMRTCAVLIAGGLCLFLCSASPGQGEDKPAVSVRIEPLAGKDVPTIDYTKPFRVVLTNESNRTLRLWLSYPRFSFRFRNLRTDEVHQVRWSDSDVKMLWEDFSTWIEVFPGIDDLTFEIHPQDSYGIPVRFTEGFADEDGYMTRSDFNQGWRNLPAFNSGDSFEVTAVFESYVGKETPDLNIWTGKVVSPAVTVNFIAADLKPVGGLIATGFEKAAIRMLEKNAEAIQEQNDDQSTLLHFAAIFGRIKVAKWLLDHGAKIEAVDVNGQTPLDCASDPAVVELLLQKNPDLTVGAGSSGTPLQRAARSFAHAQLVDQRKKWGQIANLLRKQGAVCDLESAVALNDLTRIKEIVEQEQKEFDPETVQEAFRTAVRLGHVEVCRYLIEQLQADVNDAGVKTGYPAIVEAVRFPWVMKLLIHKGVNLKSLISFQGSGKAIMHLGDDASILHFAAVSGDAEMIRLLIDSGVDVFVEADDPQDWKEDGGQFALEMAASFGNLATAQALVLHPDFVTADEEDRREVLDRGLMACVMNQKTEVQGKYVEVVQLLLKKGASASAKNKWGTVMQMVASHVHPDSFDLNARLQRMRLQKIYQLLKQHGAKVDMISAVAFGDIAEVKRLLKEDPSRANERRADGYPALHLAVGLDFREVVQELIRAGVDVSILNKSNKLGSEDATALHVAAGWGRPEMAKLLLDARADVNAVDQSGSTPLHEAARMRNLRIARLMLDRGADLTLKDETGNTPAEVAEKAKWVEGGDVGKLIREFQTRKGK